jgi:hypothetical protein
MNGSDPAQVTISGLNATGIDADLDLATYRVKANHITESTAGHGVVCDVKSNLMLWGG